jgi:hypothetical protein
MWYPVKRTPEQGHEPKCLAQAMITAIENIRDLEGVGLVEFRQMVQTPGYVLSTADAYLEGGDVECICPPPEDDGKDSFSG